jgi:hypothetical protein
VRTFPRKKLEHRDAVTLPDVADRRCASCGKPLTGRADARTCGATCGQRLHRQLEPRVLPWQAAARRLELQHPERWAQPPPRVVVRDTDLW